MQSLYPLFWILGTIILYMAIGLCSVLIWECVKNRSYLAILQYIGYAAVVIGVGSLIHAASPVMYFITVALLAGGYAIRYAATSTKVAKSHGVGWRQQMAKTVATHLVLLTGAIIFICPFIWLVSTSFKEEDQIFKYPPVWVPTRQVQVKLDGKKCGLSRVVIDGKNVKVAEILDLDDGSKKVKVLAGQPHAGEIMTVNMEKLSKIRKFGLRWENYTDALDFVPKGTHKGLLYLWNTLYVTILSVLGTLISSSMVAYSFARLKWPGKELFFALLLATMMLPGAVTMMPVFLIFRSLGWVDTLRPLWVPTFFGGAFSVFLLRQFFMTIPQELEEAARIDGAGYWTTFWKIMIQQVKPALAAVAIMTFMGSWNNFMGPLIYLNSPEKMTLAYALQLFQGEHSAEFGMVMAASTMVMIPVLLLFFFTQRYFIEGVTLTGIKG
ncbi:MAG: carbohydrate ABC transporter permease [Armatimonadota bacterium]|nr:carbohydrate ABC transporter permease [bacterium]